MDRQVVKPPFAWAIHEGDCIDVMRTLAPESIDAVITSPPYAMQRKATYGGVPEADYPEWTVAWMREVRRVLKPDGNAVINIRPHVRNGQISDYALRTRLALRGDGWAEVEELIWHKKGGAPLGHVKRPRRSWESLHWFAKHGQPFCDPKAAGEYRENVTGGMGRGGAHIGAPLASKGGWSGVARVTDVVEMSTRKNENDSDLNRHPAPYPPALAEWIARLVCPPGGTILDPFNGSGSTGVAAIRGGWSYVGIDAVPEYAAMSRKRLEATCRDVEMLADDAHTALAATLNECKASVVLSGYASPLYESLFDGWHRTELKAPTALSGNAAEPEVLRSNVPLGTQGVLDLGGIA